VTVEEGVFMRAVIYFNQMGAQRPSSQTEAPGKALYFSHPSMISYIRGIYPQGRAPTMADDTVDAVGSLDPQSGQGGAGISQIAAPAKETTTLPEPAGGVAPASEPQRGIGTTDSVALSRELMDEKETKSHPETFAADQPAARKVNQEDIPKRSGDNSQGTAESQKEGYGSKIKRFAEEKAKNGAIKGAIKGALKMAGKNIGRLAGPAGIAYDILGNAKEANKGEAQDMAKWYTDHGMKVPQFVQEWVNKEKGN
jgi:hypothetical protein